MSILSDVEIRSRSFTLEDYVNRDDGLLFKDFLHLYPHFKTESVWKCLIKYQHGAAIFDPSALYDENLLNMLSKAYGSSFASVHNLNNNPDAWLNQGLGFTGLPSTHAHTFLTTFKSWVNVIENKKPMIEPFNNLQIKTYAAAEDKVEKIISYGLSSYGYDVRCAPEFKVFTNVNSAIVDPKDFSQECFVDIKSDVCIIPPNSFALARTTENFCIPRDILVVCLGKSTYARCGIIVNVTPLEPEWEGQVTLEFSNTTSLPAKIYANEGVAQLLFFKSDNLCEVSYRDRKGKYNGQQGITLPQA